MTDKNWLIKTAEDWDKPESHFEDQGALTEEMIQQGKESSLEDTSLLEKEEIEVIKQEAVELQKKMAEGYTEYGYIAFDAGRTWYFKKEPGKWEPGFEVNLGLGELNPIS